MLIHQAEISKTIQPQNQVKNIREIEVLRPHPDLLTKPRHKVLLGFQTPLICTQVWERLPLHTHTLGSVL